MESKQYRLLLIPVRQDGGGDEEDGKILSKRLLICLPVAMFEIAKLKMDSFANSTWWTTEIILHTLAVCLALCQLI